MVLMSHPTSTTSLAEITARAAVGPVSGQIVIAGMFLYYGALFALGVYSFLASHNKKNLPAGHPGRMQEMH